MQGASKGRVLDWRFEGREQGKTVREEKPKKGKGFLVALGLFVGLCILLALSSRGGEKAELPGTQQQTAQKAGLPEEVDKIEVAGKTISVGDLADDVFETVTDKYKIDSPTIGGGRVIHHFLDGKVLFDMTFEKRGTGPYYLTKIVIKDRNYQDKTAEIVRATLGEPPVEYETGHSSGVLITVSVPAGTTKEML